MPATYFILASFDRHGRAWIERDENDTDRETTVRDLLGAQVDHPLKVFCAEDGRWNDVSEDIARAVAERAIADGKGLSWATWQFIETHTSVQFARGLEPERHPLMAMHDETMRMLAAE